ncbi:MAG TPA: cell division protein ZapA [bacterium]|nr:cell division protein ZapA [bacterium]
MSDKKAVTVTIYGNEYTLKGEADPAYIADLAKFVDAKMNDIGKKSSAPAAKVAILASMNIADEFHRLEKAKAENLKLIETLERNLLEMKKSADGSLRHSLEQKEQTDKLKTDAAENRKKLEEATSELLRLKKELDQKTSEAEEQGKKLSDIGNLKQELAATRMKAEELSKELEGVKAKEHGVEEQLRRMKDDLDTAEGLNDEAQAEIKDLKLKLEKAEAELKKAKEEGQAGGAELKEKLEATEAELRKTKDHQGANEQVQGQVKDLRTRLDQATSDLNRLKGDLEKARQAPKADGFLPDSAKMNALFKKIDAILE